MTHEFVSVLSVLLTVLLIFVVGVATGFSLGWSRKCLYRYRDVRNQVLDDMPPSSPPSAPRPSPP